MGSKHIRKTPPNELLDRYMKEKTKKEKEQNEQKRVNAKKDPKYIDVIVKELEKKRKKFRMNLRETAISEGKTEKEINVKNKFEMYNKRKKAEEKEQNRKIDLSKAINKLNNQDKDEER